MFEIVELMWSSPANVLATVLLATILFYLSHWIAHIFLKTILLIFHISFGSYQILRIILDLVVFSVIKIIIYLTKLLRNLMPISDVDKLRQCLWQAQTYREWSSLAYEIDKINIILKLPKDSEKKFKDTIAFLKSLRENRNFKELIFQLPAYVKRDHQGIVDTCPCYIGTKNIVDEYIEEIKSCCLYLCEEDDSLLSPHEKIHFIGKLYKSLGQTALCLSGGGSLSMYHMGVLRTLIESGNYEDIHVISGTSGGSICAAFCACNTQDQLLEEVLIDVVSTDYRRNGVMAAEKIVWFPSLWTQAINFLSTGFLIDHKEYCRTCRYYFGEITFAEAYERTKKHVCISVTASSAAEGRRGPSNLLLNHISTPHVLIWSAVASSCALPGIMAPNRLMCKTAYGDIVPFEVEGEHWVDGSFEADVPFKQMSSLFSVSNFIVSQVNFHVIPFLQHKLPDNHGDAAAHSPHGMAGHSTFKFVVSTLDLDLKHRVLTLAKIGLLPKLYGQDISKMFRQSYRGDVTVVPDLKMDESVGIKAIMNPSVLDMQAYIKGGSRACWPHLSRIRHLLSIEAYIRGLLKSLRSEKLALYTSPGITSLIGLDYNQEIDDVINTQTTISKPRSGLKKKLLNYSSIVNDSSSLFRKKHSYESPLKQQPSCYSPTVEQQNLPATEINQRILNIETELAIYKRLLEQKEVVSHRTRSGTPYSKR